MPQPYPQEFRDDCTHGSRQEGLATGRCPYRRNSRGPPTGQNPVEHPEPKNAIVSRTAPVRATREGPQTRDQLRPTPSRLIRGRNAGANTRPAMTPHTSTIQAPKQVKSLSPGARCEPNSAVTRPTPPRLSAVETITWVKFSAVNLSRYLITEMFRPLVPTPSFPLQMSGDASELARSPSSCGATGAYIESSPADRCPLLRTRRA